MRNILILILLCAHSFIQAQTYFYIDQIVVEPAAPSTADPVTIHLVGNLSSSVSSIVSASAQVNGNMVTINIVADGGGIGLPVLIPHTESLLLGTLAAGTYTVVINGTNVGDFAPEPEHQFNVSGAGNPCNDITFSVQWHAFTDTALVVHLLNNSGVQFNYPNVILFDANGDTLAVETVDQFAILEESWHVLTVHPDATMPSEAFNGTLELWTGFTTELTCSWDVPVDLCPAAPCATLHPTLWNMGGALVIGTFNWTIYDGNDPVADGVFVMTDQVQEDQDTICLPPGHYDMHVTANQPSSGGWPVFGVTAEGGVSGPTQEVFTPLTVLLPFDFYGPCEDGTNAIEEAPPASGLLVQQLPGAVVVRTSDGSPLGAILLYDAHGRRVLDRTIAQDQMTIQLANAPGLYVLHTPLGVRKLMVE